MALSVTLPPAASRPLDQEIFENELTVVTLQRAAAAAARNLAVGFAALGFDAQQRIARSASWTIKAGHRLLERHRLKRRRLLGRHATALICEPFRLSSVQDASGLAAILCVKSILCMESPHHTANVRLGESFRLTSKSISTCTPRP